MNKKRKLEDLSFAYELTRQTGNNILAYPRKNIPREKVEEYFKDKLKKLLEEIDKLKEEK